MDNLTIDFNPTAKLEIQIYGNKWCTVTPDIFRSWGGSRRINGVAYEGCTFYLWTNQIAAKAQEKELA